MKLAPECRSCLLTKVRSQAGYVLSDAEQIEELVEKCAEIFDAGAAANAGAAVAAGEIHRFCYAQVKNRISMQISRSAIMNGQKRSLQR